MRLIEAEQPARSAAITRILERCAFLPAVFAVAVRFAVGVGDPEGQASKFTIVDEKILEALEAPKTTGRLNVTIAGKSYSGTVDHEGHHGHDKK